MARTKKPRKQIEATPETLAEFRLLPRRRRQRFAELFVQRASEALEDCAQGSPREKMSLARQASEVMDKLSSTDLRELQREELGRRLVAGVAALAEGSQPRFVIQLEHRNMEIPAKPTGTGEAADVVPGVDPGDDGSIPGSGSGKA